MDVQKIASALEDVSIGKETDTVHHEVCLPEHNAFNPSKVDTKTFELLELVDQYESLADDTRVNFINGHLNLSRASYNGKNYGQESWDLRPYRAAKTVVVAGDGLELEKHEYVKNPKIKRVQEPEKESEKTEKTEEGASTGKSVEKRKSDTQIKNRKTKKDLKMELLEVEEPESVVKDPIHQFGGMVPYQLRLAQKSFEEGLTSSVKLHNLRAKIDKLIVEIETDDALETKDEKPTKTR